MMLKEGALFMSLKRCILLQKRVLRLEKSGILNQLINQTRPFQFRNCSVQGKDANKCFDEDNRAKSESEESENISGSYILGSNAAPERDQAKHAIRPNVDPTKTTVFLFPGQGSQFVGMGKELLQYKKVKQMFQTASQILGYDLLYLCLFGPKSDLDKTVYSQAAVFVTSLAVIEKLKEENPQAIENCIATAGFSVGEYTALVFAGALSYEAALRLIKKRGTSMQMASEYISSGMMTVFCSPDAKIKLACHAAQKWCRSKGIEDPVCNIANFLYPDCKVVAGNTEALKFIETNAADFGIKKLKHLPVSGAFHTVLMKSAEYVMKQVLTNTSFETPLIPVYSNVDGKPYQNADHIRAQLAKQITHPVKWEQTMHVIYERPSNSLFPVSYVCGPDQSLRTILKMVNLKAWDSSHSINA